MAAERAEKRFVQIIPSCLVKLTPKATLLVPSSRFAPCGAAYRGR